MELIEKPKKLTQHQKIMLHIVDYGFIDSIIAFEKYRISQFHTRMKELKAKGQTFVKTYDDKKKVNRYSLEVLEY